MRPTAIVIVNFNTRDHLRACLRSAVCEGAASIVVADNGSSDGSVDMVRREFPGVTVDVDVTNPGYGAGANRGIRLTAPMDALVLNSDTRLMPSTVRALQAYLDVHERAGLVGPRLVYPDGSLQRSCFPFPSPLCPPCQHNPLTSVLRLIPVLREWCLATWSHQEPRIVPYVMGAALLIRREAFDTVGGFDESFFMYSEEADLAFRMRQAGWETHFAPVADVVHVSGASTQQQRAAMVEQVCVSSMQFYRRHFSGARLVHARFAVRCGMAFRLVRDLARYTLAEDGARRQELAENLAIWRRAFRDVSHAGSAS